MSDYMEPNKFDEIEFHNNKYKESSNISLFKLLMKRMDGSLYTVTTRSHEFYKTYLTSICDNKKILEYGCGVDTYGLLLSSKGGIVTGIDISDIAIARAKINAINSNNTSIEYLVMDAESLKFDENTFYIISGTGIIHHLNIDKAFSEISRTITQDGSAIFLEPLGYNPIINLYRRLTPGIRTRDEHPLLEKDIIIIKKYFNDVDVYYFHLLSFFAVPFFKLPGFNVILDLLDTLDSILFRNLPFMRKYASIIIIIASGPIKSTNERDNEL